MLYVDDSVRIDPGNAFRIVVKCARYKAIHYYGIIEMAEQWHDLWVDICIGYNLDSFVTDMASKIYWGTCQELTVWAVDSDSAAKWKIRKNEHFEKMIKSRFHDRLANLVVEVVEKRYQQDEEVVETRGGSMGSSGVTSQAQPAASMGNSAGLGDTFSCNVGEDVAFDEDFLQEIVDWDTLVVLHEADNDGEATEIADEDRVFEAMGFKDADEREEQIAAAENAIPVMPEEMQQDMIDAAVGVDDNDPAEPYMDWDRDNPEMYVGTIYPCMDEFRLAVRQHAIVTEFELGTEKSDKSRFRGYCRAPGCGWIIRAKTQKDGCVRVHLLTIACHMFIFCY